MTSLPSPPVPANADLRDFAFMPVDINRLFGSAFHARANDAEWRGGFTLWLKSWHQVPAGSLPKDDIELCRLAELGRDAKTWKRIRGMALHGWAEHADGRLYHSVVSQKAGEAWKRKLDQRTRTLKARIAALEKRLNSAANSGDKDHLQTLLSSLRQSLSQTQLQTSVTATKRQGQGQGQGQGEGQGDSRSYSEPIGSGAEAPAAIPDLAKVIFTQGRIWLEGVTGKDSDACRELLGKWKKALGDAGLVAALGQAQREGVEHPESWFQAVITRRRKAGSAMPETVDEAMAQFAADPAWRGVAA